MHSVFGPVYSRRLGWSLGINNLPEKMCSYSCAYCQAGYTRHKTIGRSTFFRPGTIYQQVGRRLEDCQKKDIQVDYITFVPNGEPTLDKNLRAEIGLLKRYGHRVAVVTNGSLLWKRQVREALAEADWISIKVDSTGMDLWKRLNNPHKMLNIDRILGGILEFRDGFKHMLVTETMLVKDINDHWSALESVARFLAYLKPDICYIAAPVRPPASKAVEIPTPRDLEVAEKLFHVYGLRADRLWDTRTDRTWPSDLAQQLVAIARVHPVDEVSVVDLFGKNPGYQHVVQRLLRDGRLHKTVYKGNTYYVAGRAPSRPAVEENMKRTKDPENRGS